MAFGSRVQNCLQRVVLGTGAARPRWSVAGSRRAARERSWHRSGRDTAGSAAPGGGSAHLLTSLCVPSSPLEVGPSFPAHGQHGAVAPSHGGRRPAQGKRGRGAGLVGGAAEVLAARAGNARAGQTYGEARVKWHRARLQAGSRASQKGQDRPCLVDSRLGSAISLFRIAIYT